MNKERQFNTEDASKKLVMLMEEVGDVQIVLLGLASLLEIDMFDAVIAKETQNRKRTWR